MTVSKDELAAFVDGELGDETACRVRAAIAADPALFARAEAMIELKGRLSAHFAPEPDEAVPPEWVKRITAARAGRGFDAHGDDAGRGNDGNRGEDVSRVVAIEDFTRARTWHEADAKADRSRNIRQSWFWRSGPAIAAALVLGLFMGNRFSDGGATRAGIEGRIVAGPSLSHALDRQLASTEPSNGTGLRILASFQRRGGGFCRVYAAQDGAGIACRDDGAWILARSTARVQGAQTAYRQAGSSQAALMAAAQDMAAAPPLDAKQERAARDSGWTR